MNIGTIIEVAIGVMFVWIMLAAITSQVQDWISQWLQWRPKLLEESIRNILADDELAGKFYDHPLIKSLHSKNGTRKPSQIPNRQFASVVFDMIINANTEESVGHDMQAALEKFRTNVTAIRRNAGDDLNNLAQSLDTILVDVSAKAEKAEESLAEARNRVESWFNDSMDRLSGAYKRKAQAASLLIGVVLAAALNADSLAIANKLWSDPLVREALVAQADQFQLPQEQQSQDPQAAAAAYIGKLQGLSVPLGWTPDNMPGDANGWFLKIGGLIVSGIAAAQGAPFWFDMMRKLLSIRSGGGGSSGPAKKEEGKG